MSLKALLGCSFALVLFAPAGTSQEEGTVHVRAWIDGRSRLILDDATATWQHFDFAAPGRLDCDIGVETQPTFLDGIEWWPVWPDVPTCENRDCNGCTSDTYTGLATPIPNGAFVPTLIPLVGRGAMHVVEYPTPANGYRVVIEFDDNPTGGAAWYEVELVLSDCGVVPYCTSEPNSSGAAATIDVTGSLSVSQTDTVLFAAGCPTNRVGVFVYGSAPVKMPFCNGTLCVSPYYPGLYRVPDMVSIDAVGVARCPLDFQGLPSAGAITSGSTWYFQFWFRDHPAGGASANFTNGARVTFCP